MLEKLFCIFNILLTPLTSYFRLGFVAAREGHIAEILCSIHETQETPMPAVLVQVPYCAFKQNFDKLIFREVDFSLVV